jgi:polar amino acid transport system substrate-binding protein
MTSRTSTQRVIGAISVGLALLLLNACGDAAHSPGARETPGPQFDQALHDKLPQSIKDARKIRIASDASYAPMSFFAPGGRTIIGVEPDLAHAMGIVLGVTFEFFNTEFSKILPQVTNGEVGAGISAMSDTPEREKSVDFVNYFSAGTSMIVQSGNPTGVTDIKDLCGKKVAVEKGTTQSDLLTRAQPGCGSVPMRIQRVPTYSDALLQLRTGRAIAILADYPPARYLTTQPRTRSHYQMASTAQYEPGLFGMAISKQQPGLRDAVQGAIETLVHDGTYADILQHWDVLESRVNQVTINSGR